MPVIWMDVDAALSEVPVNVVPLIDDTDFKTREESVAYNATGLDLVWNFVTTAGAMTQTAVTPTTGGDYDWSNQGNGHYAIEIPASGGASINNDTEGFGWFSGVADGVLPWIGPVIGFRAAAVNNALVDGAAAPVVTSDLPTNFSALAINSGRVDVGRIAGNTDAASNLSEGAQAIISGQAVTGTLTTTGCTTNLTGYADDDLIGSTGVFYTGDAAGQRFVVTDYASSGGTLTFERLHDGAALATAPANGDKFVLV